MKRQTEPRIRVGLPGFTDLGTPPGQPGSPKWVWCEFWGCDRIHTAQNAGSDESYGHRETIRKDERSVGWVWVCSHGRYLKPASFAIQSSCGAFVSLKVLKLYFDLEQLLDQCYTKMRPFAFISGLSVIAGLLTGKFRISIDRWIYPET